MEHAEQGFVNLHWLRRSGVGVIGVAEDPDDHRSSAPDRVKHQQMRFVAIMKMGGAGLTFGGLRDFNGIRQAVAEGVGISAGEGLGPSFQTAKGARMNHTVAVALKLVAVGVWRLRMTAPARLLHADSIGSEKQAFSHQLSAISDVTAVTNASKALKRDSINGFFSGRLRLTAESYLL